MATLKDRPIFCASSLEAQALPEQEFWARVFSDGKTEEEREQEEADHYQDMFLEFMQEDEIHDRWNGYYVLKSWEGEAVRVISPESACLICDAHGACGYDTEGRPWIHCLPDDET